MIRTAVGDVNYMVDVLALVVAPVLVLADTAGSGYHVLAGGFPAGGVWASFAAIPVMARGLGGHSDITLSASYCGLAIWLSITLAA